MKGLTKRQQEILNFLQKHLNDFGYWPSIREIQKQFKFKSTNSVMGHLKALEQKNCINRTSGQARAFRLSTHPSPQSQPQNNTLSIPIYGSIAAGYPDRVESSGEIGTIQIDASISGLSNHESPRFALRVRGESMIDAGIFEGDIVIIEASQPYHNNIVAALIDGESTLKRFISREGEPPYLKAENPAYPDLMPAEHLEIQGIARSVIRSL